MDTIHNLYSNFKYGVAYDGPNHWEFDYGASEHSIYSTYQIDSALVFNIIVIDLKIDKTKQMNIWELYQENKAKTDKLFYHFIKTKGYILQ